jgi:hypothetical protein
MRDKNLDDMLSKAAEAPGLDPAIVDRISKSISSDLQAVAPLPSPWILTSGLVAIGGVLGLGGALLLGPHGVRKMSALEIGVIFPVLAALLLAAATLSVATAIPGSRRFITPRSLAVTGAIALGALFSGLFRDYATEAFVWQGAKCLTAGLGFALPAWLATWLLLRRGFSVDTVATGLARGTLAGLVGVTMLELHCPNFEAPHLLVWHIGVLAVSSVVGAVAGWMSRNALKGALMENLRNSERTLSAVQWKHGIRPNRIERTS